MEKTLTPVSISRYFNAYEKFFLPCIFLIFLWLEMLRDIMIPVILSELRYGHITSVSYYTYVIYKSHVKTTQKNRYIPTQTILTQNEHVERKVEMAFHHAKLQGLYSSARTCLLQDSSTTTAQMQLAEAWTPIHQIKSHGFYLCATQLLMQTAGKFSY